MALVATNSYAIKTGTTVYIFWRGPAHRRSQIKHRTFKKEHLRIAPLSQKEYYTPSCHVLNSSPSRHVSECVGSPQHRGSRLVRARFGMKVHIQREFPGNCRDFGDLKQGEKPRDTPIDARRVPYVSTRRNVYLYVEPIWIDLCIYTYHTCHMTHCSAHQPFSRVCQPSHKL